MNTPSLASEANLPAGNAETPAKIHVFIPRRKEPFVEATGRGISLATHEQGCRSGLTDFLRVERTNRNTAILPHYGPRSRERPSQILLVDEPTHGAHTRIVV